MELDKTREAAIKRIAIEGGIDITSPKNLILLIRAVDYANISDFYETPSSRYELIQNEIFIIKGLSYFKRKSLNPFTNIELIDKIRDQEHYEVAIRKMRLP